MVSCLSRRRVDGVGVACSLLEPSANVKTPPEAVSFTKAAAARLGAMVRRAQTSESCREPRVNEARCASFRRLGHCEQARDFRAKASKQQPAASTPIKRAHGPHGPPAARSEHGRAASRAEEGLPRDGLRRPQRRRADRRRGDARDLRDLRVSSQPAAAAEQKACVRRGWRRDGPVRHPCASSVELL